MEEQKHTPGPWVARDCNNDFEWEVVVLDPSQTWNEPHDRCWYVATVMDDADGGSAEANARLIAASPDLLEALKQSVIVLTDAILRTRSLEDAENWTIIRDAARAAIAKATQP